MLREREKEEGEGDKKKRESERERGEMIAYLCGPLHFYSTHTQI